MWLQVNGVAEPFAVVKLSSNGNHLDLQTGEWYKGPWPWVLHYEKVK